MLGKIRVARAAEIANPSRIHHGFVANAPKCNPSRKRPNDTDLPSNINKIPRQFGSERPETVIMTAKTPPGYTANRCKSEEAGEGVKCPRSPRIHNFPSAVRDDFGENVAKIAKFSRETRELTFSPPTRYSETGSGCRGFGGKSALARGRFSRAPRSFVWEARGLDGSAFR